MTAPGATHGKRYKDFDEAVAALDPIQFKVRGRDYRLEEDPKASTILTLLKDGAMDDPSQAPDLLIELVGETNYAQLLEDGVSLTQLVMLAQWIAEECGLEVDEPVADKRRENGGPPASAPKRSSKAGRR